MKTVLVTGAAGALGQAVVAYLKNSGAFRVVTMGRRSDVTDIGMDMRHPEQLAPLISRIAPDWIFHLAATFAHDFDEAYAVNVAAARHILEYVLRSESRTRVLLIGSAAEYGPVPVEANPVRESHPLHPVSVYGLTKAWQTQLAGFYAHQGIHVVVGRIFNLDGPNLSERLFIGRLQKQISAVIAGNQSHIELGPLNAVRDYIALEDAARQLFSIASSGASGEVYHVASGVPVAMRDLLSRYLDKHNIDASIVKESIASSNRVGYDIPVIYADIAKTSALVRTA